MPRARTALLKALLNLALLCALAPGPAQASGAPLRLVVTPAASGRGNEIADDAIALLMHRAGLAYTLAHEPTARALASFRAGRYEADMLRQSRHDRIAPGAIRVDPHLLSTTILAFSRSAAVAPRSWAELAGLRVAYVRGIKLIEQGLAGHEAVELTSRAESCLTMVAIRRADVCLLNAERDYGAGLRIRDQALHRSVLARVNLHVWVAPGQEDLARQLSAALRALVASGELAQVAAGNR